MAAECCEAAALWLQVHFVGAILTLGEEKGNLAGRAGKGKGVGKNYLMKATNKS